MRCSRRRILTPVFASLLLWAGGAFAGDDIYQRAGADGTVQLSNIPDDADYQLVVKAPVAPVVAVPAGADVSPLAIPSRAAPYRDVVAQAARQAKVDVRLVHAVIAVESGYNPAAVSRKGAVGLMQLMPETARRYGAGDGRDPGRNVRAGALYLADLLKMFGNDLDLALAAYNAGEKAVVRHGRRVPPYRETVSYVPKVLAVYRQLKTLSI